MLNVGTSIMEINEKENNVTDKITNNINGMYYIVIIVKNELSNSYNDNLTPYLSNCIPPPSNISADIKLKFWKNHPIQPFLEIGRLKQFTCNKCLACAYILIEELSKQSGVFNNLYIVFKCALILPLT